MYYFEFLSDLFIPNVELYLLSLIISMAIVYFFLKCYALSIIDPLVFHFVMSGFANSIPLFLFFTGHISAEHFSYFIFAESSFWLGFVFLYKKEIDFRGTRVIEYKQLDLILFKFCFFFYVVTTLFSYYKFGIPLFLENRNDVYKDSGGFGALIYFLPFPYTYTLFYSFFKILVYKNKRYLLALALMALFSLLDGGKAQILVFVFTFFVLNTFLLKKTIKIQKKYFILILSFPILVFFSRSGNVSQSFLSLGERFMANGDGYFMAYPYNDIDRIKVQSPFLYIFSPVFRTFRLVHYKSDTAEPIGLKLVNEVYPESLHYGITASPNTRPPIAGWVCFKWWGILFTFISGMLVGFLMGNCRRFFSKTIYGITFFYLVYSAGYSGITDSFLIQQNLIVCFISFCFYYSIVVFLKKSSKKT